MVSSPVPLGGHAAPSESYADALRNPAPPPPPDDRYFEESGGAAGDRSSTSSASGGGVYYDAYFRRAAASDRHARLSTASSLQPDDADRLPSAAGSHSFANVEADQLVITARQRDRQLRKERRTVCGLGCLASCGLGTCAGCVGLCTLAFLVAAIALIAAGATQVRLSKHQEPETWNTKLDVRRKSAAVVVGSTPPSETMARDLSKPSWAAVAQFQGSLALLRDASSGQTNESRATLVRVVHESWDSQPAIVEDETLPAADNDSNKKASKSKKKDKKYHPLEFPLWRGLHSMATGGRYIVAHDRALSDDAPAKVSAPPLVARVHGAQLNVSVPSRRAGPPYCGFSSRLEKSTWSCTRFRTTQVDLRKACADQWNEQQMGDPFDSSMLLDRFFLRNDATLQTLLAVSPLQPTATASSRVPYALLSLSFKLSIRDSEYVLTSLRCRRLKHIEERLLSSSDPAGQGPPLLRFASRRDPVQSDLFGKESSSLRARQSANEEDDDDDDDDLDPALFVRASNHSLWRVVDWDDAKRTQTKLVATGVNQFAVMRDAIIASSDERADLMLFGRRTREDKIHSLDKPLMWPYAEYLKPSGSSVSSKRTIVIESMRAESPDRHRVSPRALLFVALVHDGNPDVNVSTIIPPRRELYAYGSNDEAEWFSSASKDDFLSSPRPIALDSMHAPEDITNAALFTTQSLRPSSSKDSCFDVEQFNSMRCLLVQTSEGRILGLGRHARSTPSGQCRSAGGGVTMIVLGSVLAFPTALTFGALLLPLVLALWAAQLATCMLALRRIRTRRREIGRQEFDYYSYAKQKPVPAGEELAPQDEGALHPQYSKTGLGAAPPSPTQPVMQE